jgi:MYXO-CTERM domain-containing protein
MASAGGESMAHDRFCTNGRSKMKSTRRITVLAAALLTTLASTHAWAHWCDDLWSSAYNIIVRPDSDTSPKELYVENHWGYQFLNFKLTATSSSGGTVTLTPPSTLKVKDTLLPGEKGTWKITAGTPAKIEDLTFHVTFGEMKSPFPTQYACYPVLGASPVMVIKNDGKLFPNAIAGIPKGTTELPKANTPNGCTYGDVPLGRSLQQQTIADWDDVNVGLDNLLTLYCSGRGSWGNNDKSIKPTTYCKDGTSTTCPTRPTAIPGSRSDYMRLWSAGAMAIRKDSLGTRLPTFRKRLMCGINDGDPGISGYTMFVLGYLGDDAESKKFLQDQSNATGDGATIAKAALYLMGDTSQKSAVQAGVKSSSVWVKVACAGAVGIVDKDDDAVTSAIIPEVKWIEPDSMGGTTDNGKGMYSAHILEIVANNRRGWAFREAGKGAVTFYGETGTPATGGSSGSTGSDGTGGKSGTAGSTGTGAAGAAGGSTSVRSSSASPGGTTSSGGRASSGGSSAAPSSDPPKGGSSAVAGSSASGGQSASSSESKSSVSSSAVAGGGSSSSSAQGGASAPSSSSNESTAKASGDSGNGCSCNLSDRAPRPGLLFTVLAGLALLIVRRRRS